MIIIILQMKKKKRWMKNIALIIYLMKVSNLFIQSKKMKKKVNHGRKKLLLKDKIKKTKKKSDDKDLTDTSSLEGGDFDEFIDIPDMPPLEGDEEEVKEGKRLKILTPDKLLTRLPILLAQIKAGNNSCNLKNEIRQILHLLYQHNKITKNY